MKEQLFKAFCLGILEGLTEFIPVSSTGHMVLLGNALEFTGDKAKVFEIFIQLGAILAVLLLYWRYFIVLICPKFKTPETLAFVGWKGILKLILVTTPAAILGLLFHGQIKMLLEPLPVAIALIVGGLLLIGVEKRNKTVRVNAVQDITYLDSLLVGCFQCLALWPGMSRSGSTIIGSRLLGFRRDVAAQFSFIIAVPIMFAAVGYDLWKNRNILEVSDLPVFAVGFVVSFITAIFAIKFFLKILQRYTLCGFGWYRIVLGIFVIGLHLL